MKFVEIDFVRVLTRAILTWTSPNLAIMLIGIISRSSSNPYTIMTKLGLVMPHFQWLRSLLWQTLVQICKCCRKTTHLTHIVLVKAIQFLYVWNIFSMFCKVLYNWVQNCWHWKTTIFCLIVFFLLNLNGAMKHVLPAKTLPEIFTLTRKGQQLWHKSFLLSPFCVL